MTFEEYAQKHLGTAGLSFTAMELVRMGWNARGSYGSCQEILDSSASEIPEGLDATTEEWARINGRDHIADASKMVQGSVQAMGNLCFNEEDDYTNAVVIEFASREDLKAALESGQCRFTVFGGEV